MNEHKKCPIDIEQLTAALRDIQAYQLLCTTKIAHKPDFANFNALFFSAI